MKKVIRLTEADIENIVRKVLSEQLITKDSDVDIRELSTMSPVFDRLVNRLTRETSRIEGLGVPSIDKPREINKVIYYPINDLNKAMAVNGFFTLRKVKDKNGKVVLGYTVDNQSIYDNRQKSWKSVEGLIDANDTQSLEALNKLKEVNPLFLAYLISQSDRVLNQLQGKKNKKVIIKSKETEKVVPAPPSIPVEVVQFDDAQDSFDTKFPSGSPTISENYKTKFDTAFKQSVAAAVKAANTSVDIKGVSFKGGARIVGINVMASSSNVPQTNLPAPYNDPQTGFLALSKARAESMLEMVNSMIQTNGYGAEGVKPTMKYDGFETDSGIPGTSGPVWDKSKGSQHADYLNNQKAVVTITFQPIPSYDEPEPEPDTITTENDFILDASGEGKRRINIVPPPIKFRIDVPDFGGFRLISTGRDLPCPFDL